MTSPHQNSAEHSPPTTKAKIGSRKLGSLRMWPCVVICGTGIHTARIASAPATLRNTCRIFPPEGRLDSQYAFGSSTTIPRISAATVAAALPMSQRGTAISSVKPPGATITPVSSTTTSAELIPVKSDAAATRHEIELTFTFLTLRTSRKDRSQKVLMDAGRPPNAISRTRALRRRSDYRHFINDWA